MRQRGQITAGPHRALARDHGQHPGVQNSEQSLEHHQSGARVALGQHVGPQQHHGPRLFGLEGLPYAAAVAEYQVALQGPSVGPGHPHLGELAEPGGHAVDDGILGQQTVDILARPLDARNRGWGQVHSDPTPGHERHIR